MENKQYDMWAKSIMRKFKKSQFSFLDRLRSALVDLQLYPLRQNCARKPRLLICNICQYLCRVLDFPALREAIDFGYDFADDPLTIQNAQTIHQKLREEYFMWRYPWHTLPPDKERLITVLGMEITNTQWSGVHGPIVALRTILDLLPNTLVISEEKGEQHNKQPTCEAIGEVFDDLYGSLPPQSDFRELVPYPGIQEIAHDKYKHYEFSLEDMATELARAGICQGRIYDHCLRKVHMRGCWLVDALLSGLPGNENYVTGQMHMTLNRNLTEFFERRRKPESRGA